MLPLQTRGLSLWAGTGRWSVLWLMLTGVWIGVLAWYVLCICLSAGLLVVYRITRRVQSRGERNRLRHAELVQAIERGRVTVDPSRPGAIFGSGCRDESRLTSFPPRVSLCVWLPGQTFPRQAANVIASPVSGYTPESGS
jgi:hypothetical protein